MRDRVALVNAKLRNAAGEVQLFVDPQVQGTDRRISSRCRIAEDSTQIDKDKDRKRTHLSDALGYLIWQEVQERNDRGTRSRGCFERWTDEFTYRTGTSGLHAKARMWRRYRDLYAGGEQFRQNAAEYLVRRQKEPLEVYQERLARVFYENYLGSIVDWYTATLVRRRAGDRIRRARTIAAKDFFAALRAELRSARHDADAVFQATD